MSVFVNLYAHINYIQFARCIQVIYMDQHKQQQKNVCCNTFCAAITAKSLIALNARI